MKRIANFRIIAMFMMAVILLSCSGKKADIATMIPKDVGMLMSIDMKSLHEKGNLAEFNKTKMYAMAKNYLQMIDPKAVKSIDDIINNSDLLGLNVKSNAYFYMTKDMKFGGFIIEMKDKAQFDKFLKEQRELSKAKQEPEKIGDYLALPDAGGIFAWNDKVAYALINTEHAPKETMINEFKKMTSLKAEESLSANPKYQDFIKEKKDISVWMDLSIFSSIFEKSTQMMGGGVSFTNMAKLFNGSHVFMHADFATDEINVSVKSIEGDELKKVINFQNLYKNSTNEKLFSIIPADAIMVTGSSMNMDEGKKGVKEVVRLIGEDLKKASTVNESIDKLTFVYTMIDKYFDKLTGDIVFALTDFSVPMQENMYSSPEPKIGLTYIIGVNDNELLESIAADAEMKLEKVGEYYQMPLDGNNVMKVAVINNMLIATTDDKVLEYAQAGQAPSSILTTPYKDKLLKGNYGFMNLDLTKYPQGFQQMMSTVPMSAAAPYISKLIFDKVEFVTDYKALTSSVKIQFKKSNTNSFLALIKMIDTMIP